MRAKFVLHGNTMMLHQISSESMSALHARPDSSWLTGYPAYFDEYKRLWPRPDASVPDVEFEVEGVQGE